VQKVSHRKIAFQTIKYCVRALATDLILSRSGADILKGGESMESREKKGEEEEARFANFFSFGKLLRLMSLVTRNLEASIAPVL